MATVRNPQSTATQRDPRAVIYCRISRDPTGLELGVRRQEQDCTTLCEQEGYEVVQVFTDDDRSAYSGKLRPQFEAMKALILSGAVDVLVAWHPDRITRAPRELEDIIDLLERTHTTVRTVQTGQVDLASASGRMTARVVGAVARHESEHKSDRLRRKHLELAAAGKLSGGGTRPFGYEQDRLTVREPEAAVIREMAARVIAGESIRSITASLNASEFRPTSGAKQWMPVIIRRVLLSPRIAGLREHKGEITAVARWDAIVDADDHRRLVAILTDPARTTNHTGPVRKLLTGLLHCGACGTKMVSRPRTDGRAAYICTKDLGGCNGCYVLGEPLDEMVVEALLERLTSLEMIEALAGPSDDEAILDDLRALETRRTDLAELWATGDVSRAEWSAAAHALDKRQAALEAALRDVATIDNTAAVVDAVTQWPTLTHDRRRQVLAALIDRIDIGPGVRGRNHFDDGRVTVMWKKLGE